jgi:uncharacterized integral membrane protein (TIGR00698 family)
LVPGLLLTAAIATLAIGVRQASGLLSLSPLILAIALGMAVRNLIGVSDRARPGIALSLKPVLRLAIVLLGLQLTFAQVREIGASGMMVIGLTLLASFCTTKILGRLLGVDPRLTELIAAGTAVCGASAVIATNTVTRGEDEDVAYAVACVTLFGSLAMIIYPLLNNVIGLAPRTFGLWTGASIHEVAQVVAAAFQAGQEAGEFGTVAKLSRVILLAPLVITLGILASMKARRNGAAAHQGQAPIPLFVLGFVAMIALNSFDLIPHAFKAFLMQVTGFMLAVALAAMGLETNIRKLREKGLRPLLLGATSWIFISIFSLGLILLTEAA